MYPYMTCNDVCSVLPSNENRDMTPKGTSVFIHKVRDYKREAKSQLLT